MNKTFKMGHLRQNKFLKLLVIWKKIILDKLIVIIFIKNDIKEENLSIYYDK